MVAQVLEQASTVTASPEGPYEMFDYVISLREGIMDAWGGIIGAMKVSQKSMFTPSLTGLWPMLTPFSPSSAAICPRHLPAPKPYRQRYEP